MQPLLSIVVPCFNEEEMIPIFYDYLENIPLPLNREYIFVNDGSKDNSLQQMKRLKQLDPSHVHYVSFSRNFGKEAGIYAGLQYAAGDFVVLMDVDLQDPPELLPEMFNILTTTDYDCVGTRRLTREGEPPIRSFFSKKFYQVINKISQTEIVDGARDYRMMTRQMVDAILQMTEYNRFSKGIFSWIGFNTKYLPYNNIERKAGETSWSFWQLLLYALDGITSFSTVPLTLSSVLGFILFILAIVLGIFFLIRTLLFGNPTSGWTSLIVIILFVSGSQLFSLGILGKYLSHIYLESKKRPLFIVKESDIRNKDRH